MASSTRQGQARRQFLFGAVGATLLLAGCQTGRQGPVGARPGSQPDRPVTPVERQRNMVALIVPTSGGDGAIGQSIANAAKLAAGLAKLGPFAPNSPQTNIVVADVLRGNLDGWLAAFRAAGVLAVPFGPRRMRMVTHINISAADITEALTRIEQSVGAVAV